MHFILRRKFISWIATLAILMSAFAPSISQALSISQTGKGFVDEICTTSGAKITQVIDDDDSSSIPSAMQGHCPYCVVSSLYALPTVTALEFHAAGRFAKQPLSHYIAPQPLFSWLSIPSRAPPALS